MSNSTRVIAVDPSAPDPAAVELAALALREGRLVAISGLQPMADRLITGRRHVRRVRQ